MLALCAAAPFAFAACGGGDDSDSESTTATTTEQTTTAEDSGGGSEGDAKAGEAVWADAGCASCHTLAAADASGTSGPDLDDLQPDFDQVVTQVTNGGGIMPAFGDSLSEQQINDVAAYVVESTSG